MTSLATPETATAASNPLDDAQDQLSAAVQTLGYGPGLHRLLAKPRRELAGVA